MQISAEVSNASSPDAFAMRRSFRRFHAHRVLCLAGDGTSAIVLEAQTRDSESEREPAMENLGATGLTAAFGFYRSLAPWKERGARPQVQ